MLTNRTFTSKAYDARYFELQAELKEGQRESKFSKDYRNDREAEAIEAAKDKPERPLPSQPPTP